MPIKFQFLLKYIISTAFIITYNFNFKYAYRISKYLINHNIFNRPKISNFDLILN